MCAACDVLQDPARFPRLKYRVAERATHTEEFTHKDACQSTRARKMSHDKISWHSALASTWNISWERETHQQPQHTCFCRAGGSGAKNRQQRREEQKETSRLYLLRKYTAIQRRTFLKQAQAFHGIESTTTLPLRCCHISVLHR